MMARGPLVGVGQGDDGPFVEEPAGKADAGRSAIPGQAGGHRDAGMAGEIGEQQVISIPGGSHIAIDLLHQLRHLLDQFMADAVGVDILDRRDEARLAEIIRPGVLDLAHQQRVAVAAGQFVESGRGLDAEDN